MNTESCHGLSMKCVKALLKRQATLLKIFGTVIIVASLIAIWYRYW